MYTLSDQDFALKSSAQSYYYAKLKIPGSDFKALQAKACEEPCYAFKRNFIKIHFMNKIDYYNS